MAGAGGGFQLPGLCDAFPTTTSTTTAPILPLYDPPTANTSRRFILDTAADSENSEDDEEEEIDFIPRPARGTKRLSALCSPGVPARRRRPSFAPIEEERVGGRVDVAAAVRLRKETKARKRASGMPSSVARVNRRGRAAAAVVIRVEAPGDDELNYADVEE